MLIFVGVGPGDPELMTLKAVRILSEADAIAIPDSGSGNSVVMKIVGKWIEGKPICRLDIPMSGKRADWDGAHERAADELLEWLKRYPVIAYPVLGDPGVYASSSYLMRKISGVHPCSVIPGVPAMCAAAAELGVPLCEQREPLTVLDNFSDGDALPSGNAVIMKSGRNLDSIRRAVDGRTAYAVRNLGMENAWCGRIADIPEDTYSYFTTVIVKK